MVRLSASAKGRVSGTDGSDAKVRRSYAESSGSAAAYNPFRIQYKYKPTALYSTLYRKAKERMAFTGSFGDKSWSRNSII
jgi:hypothetical protein